jgi:uncharacterized coiled-coil protein SlyX
LAQHLRRNQMGKRIEYLGQLLSGRVFYSIIRLRDRYKTLEGRMENLEMSTANEQKIVSAAQKLVGLVAVVQGIIAAQQEKIRVLTEQAASNQAHEPEDLSQEFAQFDDAVAQLDQIAGSLTPESGQHVDVAEEVPALGGTPTNVEDQVVAPLPPTPANELSEDDPLHPANLNQGVGAITSEDQTTAGDAGPVQDGENESQPVIEPDPVPPAEPVVGDEEVAQPVADEDDGWGEPDAPTAEGDDKDGLDSPQA